MKRFFALTALLMLVAGTASAQFLFEGENEIGIFMTETPTATDAEDMACYTGPAGQFMAYAVLTNPVNQNTGTPIANVGGFEFKLVYDASLFVTPTLHPSATNFMTPPNFFCGANIPVVGGQCTLISLTIGTFSTAAQQWLMSPVDGTPSIPGSIAITDADDNFSISEAYTAAGSYTGDFSAPVFSMFDCQVVPNDDVSFGGVKALFQ